MTKSLDGSSQTLCGDTFNWILTRRIDVGNKQDVGVIERAGKLLHEVVCPCVPVRLKQHHNAPATGTEFRSSERCADLRGMVSVIVDHQNAVHFTLRLESSPGTSETV